MSDTVARAHRYALLLSSGQEAAIQSEESQLRLAWNKMVNWHRCILRDWHHGRQTQLLSEYSSILAAKNGNTGRASLAARRTTAIQQEAAKLAKEHHLTVEAAKARLLEEGFEPVIPPRDEAIKTFIQEMQHGDPKQALKSAKKLAKEKAIPLADALAEIENQGYGANGVGTGPRRFSVKLAQERLMARAKYFYGGKKSLLYGLIQKFQKSCENWLGLKGTAEAPNYKRDQDRVAFQRQITSSTRCILPLAASSKPQTVDLSAMLGQAGVRCLVCWHRNLPAGSVVTQMAIAGRPGRRYLIVCFSCPRLSVLKPFAKNDNIAGIDPGLKCALTVVSNRPLGPELASYAENVKARREALALEFNLDQKLAEDPLSEDGKALAGALKVLARYLINNNGVLELQPPLARDKDFLARLRRLQRKKDRQKRAVNPDCFNPDGTWKKGKRARNVSKNLIETHRREQRLHEQIADSRREFYHLVAFHLLRLHGHLKMGDWQPEPIHKEKKPLPKGEAKKRRNMNRKALDHAIAMFKAIVQDKANLSASPRTVEFIDEAYTTRTCGCCRAATGPEGPTSVTYWKCSKCGAENHRKANAAENIRISTAVNVVGTAGAQPVAALSAKQ